MSLPLPCLSCGAQHDVIISCPVNIKCTGSVCLVHCEADECTAKTLRFNKRFGWLQWCRDGVITIDLTGRYGFFRRTIRRPFEFCRVRRQGRSDEGRVALALMPFLACTAPNSVVPPCRPEHKLAQCEGGPEAVAERPMLIAAYCCAPVPVHSSPASRVLASLSR